MQHLRTITRKASDRRREQRQILLQAHAARAASVAKGKAKRKWGYNRSALKRIEGMGKGGESDGSSSSKTKTKATQDRRSKRTPSSESTDTLALKDDRHGKLRLKNTKRKDPAGDRYNTDEATGTSTAQVEIEARGKSRRRGTFWNNYQGEDEA
jgi:hypothetical protein